MTRPRRAAISESLNPVRDALKRTRPVEKPHAHQKYWQQLPRTGYGGRVREPLLELTDEEKAATHEAFKQCDLRV